jgi:hypothetical protein
MPLEVLHDGFVRRFTPMAPRDWMSFVEVGERTPLPLFVFLGDGPIADWLRPGSAEVQPGMSNKTGVSLALYPRDPILNPQYAPYTFDRFADPPPFPKFFALFVEGLNPTDAPNGPTWGFSTDFGAHDGGPMEVVYGKPLPWPWLPSETTRLGEKALIRQLVTWMMDQLDATWTRWYGHPPLGPGPMFPPPFHRPGNAVDRSRIFVVGQGAAATLALDLLNADPAGAFEFAGAALVVGKGGGTIGGRVIADPEGLAAGDPFAGQFPIGITHLPLPASSAKAILAICDIADPHTGAETDTLSAQAPYPPGPPESATSRALLETGGLDPAGVAEFVRLEHTVFASLNEWTEPLGLGARAFTAAVPQPALPPLDPAVTSWLLESIPGTGLGKIQVLGIQNLGDAWPHQQQLGQEGLLAIFQFFDTFDP